MDNQADSAAKLDARHSLSRWVEEMQGVVQMITHLMDDNDRQRTASETALREREEQRAELARLRTEIERHQGELDRERTATRTAVRESNDLQEELGRLRSEIERQSAATEVALRERDEVRAELAALHADNDRLRTEQMEAGETAAKLLGEMKDLVNQVAHKFQGPVKASPFAREPRSPQP